MPPKPLEQECSCCHSAGIVRAPSLAPDEALLCPRCKGRGSVPIRERLFTGRKRLPGVNRIVSKGAAALTYEEFEAAIPCARVRR